jgi:hypothetical protein
MELEDFVFINWIMSRESWLDGVAGAATGRRDSLQDGEELLGAGGAEDEGAGLVVVMRALFPSGESGEDNGAAFEAFGAVDGVTGDGGRGVAR